MDKSNLRMFSAWSENIVNLQKKVPDSRLFMFKKKSSLIRKLWKYAKFSGMDEEIAADIKSKLRSLLKSLSEENLKTLSRGIKSKGGVDTNCIHVRTSELRHFQRYIHYNPKLILAQAFRYPQMNPDDYLRDLLCCCPYNHCVKDHGECVNPYHSSLVIHTDSTLPPSYDDSFSSHSPLLPSLPYSNCWPTSTWSETVASNYSEHTEITTTSTCSKSLYGSFQSADSFYYDLSTPWCRITYWEHKSRVGKILDVRTECVDVFDKLPHGEGLCLANLNPSTFERSESSEKVRRTIGYGFQLSKEYDGIWLYNRSDVVLFTGSPTFQTTVSHPVVKRLPPGSSVLVLDPNLLTEVNLKKNINEGSQLDSGYDASEQSGSFASKLYPYCIRVSFGKGWGENYTRMSITQCPCWMEIYLNVRM